MKIYLTTFGNALSYGAIMQAYALADIIKKNGHEAMLLNVECRGNEKYSAEKTIKRILGSGASPLKKSAQLARYVIFQKGRMNKKAKGFSDFKEKYINEISGMDKIAEADAKESLFVCGSDQIWNPNITGGFEDVFFGINEKGIKAISYAASVGNVELLAGRETEFLEKISNLEKVSSRERDLNDFLVEHNVQSVQTLDPTLIFDIKSLEKCTPSAPLVKGSYILFFYLGKKKDFLKYAKGVQKRFQKKVVFFSGSDIPVPTTKTTFGDKAPEEFVNLFKNAEYVVTNSFHGLAFSLRFHKQFSVILPSKRPERLVNLLEIIGQKSRIINDTTALPATEIDYEDVEKCMAPYRKKSLEYLDSVLGNNENE